MVSRSAMQGQSVSLPWALAAHEWAEELVRMEKVTFGLVRGDSMQQGCTAWEPLLAQAITQGLDPLSPPEGRSPSEQTGDRLGTWEEVGAGIRAGSWDLSCCGQEGLPVSWGVRRTPTMIDVGNLGLSLDLGFTLFS